MGYYLGQMKPQPPGINGVQYSPKRGYLYYTASAKRLFMRVKVHPISFNPVGEVEVVIGGRIFGDFWIDQDAGFAYLTTHVQNTIDRLALEPSQDGNEILSIAGDPFSDELIGPTADIGEEVKTNMAEPHSSRLMVEPHPRRLEEPGQQKL